LLDSAIPPPWLALAYAIVSVLIAQLECKINRLVQSVRAGLAAAGRQRGIALNYLARVRGDLESSRDLFARALTDDAMMQSVARAAEIVIGALQSGRKLLLAGNGGSAADAQHLAAELVVRFKKNRAALPAIALTTDSSVLTAIGNDLGFEHVFSRQIEALGRPGDVFLGLSTSGRSPNILAACQVAREGGMAVVGFTGAGGGAMNALCDVLVRVPSDDTPFVQQVHIAIGHTLCAIAEESLGQ
jgi:D-sedoheptulose 7-phosphate isomerase